jgi:hypothetical protein
MNVVNIAVRARTSIGTGGVAVAVTEGGSVTARAVIGVVVALRATGPFEARGVIATTIAATARTAIVPPASAIRSKCGRDLESSMSSRVGPSSEGWRHVRS